MKTALAMQHRISVSQEDTSSFRRFLHFPNGTNNSTHPNLRATDLTSSNSGTWSQCLPLAGAGDVVEAMEGALNERKRN
jgi:hypothetical protein